MCPDMEDKELIERSPTDKQESVKASEVAGEPSSEDLKRICEEVLRLDQMSPVKMSENYRLTCRQCGKGFWDEHASAQRCPLCAREEYLSTVTPILARALAAATKRLEEAEVERDASDAALLSFLRYANNCGADFERAWPEHVHILNDAQRREATRARLARQQEERR